MTKPVSITLFLALFLRPFISASQEIKIFKVSDFDLRGNVKSCLVITDYGKEEYEFDETGRLIKSTTRYSETDYDLTHYKFEEAELVEKRMEHYRDGEFEPSTSFANFYSVDQKEPRIVTERIYSYDKEFLDSYQYHFNSEGDLQKIIRSGPDGEDETIIGRTGEGKYKQETYISNGVIQKTETISYDKNGAAKTVLKANYVDGVRNTAIEEVFDNELKLISKTEMAVDEKTKKYVPQKVESFSYDENGILSSIRHNRGQC